MMDDVSHFKPELVKVGKVWMEKELELRFSVGPPPEEGSNDGEYLKKKHQGKKVRVVFFMYHE